MNNDKNNKRKKEKFKKEYYSAMLNFFKNEVCSLYQNAIIVDRGKCFIPRYECWIPIEQNKKFFKRLGLHNLFEIKHHGTIDFKDIYLQIDTEYQKKMFELNFNLPIPISNTVYVCSQEDYEKIQENFPIFN